MKTLSQFIFLFISVLLLTACGGGGGGSSSNSASAPTSNLQPASVGVVITDNDIDDYDQALATIRSIELIGKDGRVSLYDGAPVTVDLLDLRDYQELFSVSDDVPPGTYSKIRLRLDEFELVKLDNSGRVEESQLVDLVANGKVDLNPRGNFTIEEGDTVFITLDFDLEKSVKLTFAGKQKQPKLRPVIFVRISDAEPMGRIARVRGVIDELDLANRRFRLCEVERVSQVTIPTSGDAIDSCVMITTGDSTALFSPSGVPWELNLLAVGDPVTVVGRLVRTDNPVSIDPVLQPMATLGVDQTDRDWDGLWDLDHVWRTDCSSGVNPLKASKKGKKKGKKSDSGHSDSDAKGSDSSSNDSSAKSDSDARDSDSSGSDSGSDGCGGTGDRFGFAALIVEIGSEDTWGIWRGETASEISAGRFEMDLDPGQGFDNKPVTARVWETTRIVSLSGEMLGRRDVVPGQRATLDAVYAKTAEELRASFLALDIEASTQPPEAEAERGEVIGIDTITGKLEVSTGNGQACVDASEAAIVFVGLTGDGIEAKRGDLEDIEVGQKILPFGPRGDGCLKARVIIVGVPE